MAILYRSVLLGLALLLAHQPTWAQTHLSADHPKARTAGRVFNALVQAIGDGRPPPTLRLTPIGPHSSMVAALHPHRSELILGERAFDLCMAQGADSLAALAFLLGHELAHHYRGHGWTGDFGQRFADLEVGQTHRLFDPVRQVELEGEADYFGGFAGHLAGYPTTLAVAPRLLQAIYSTYGLKADLEGYPALPERQAITQRAAEDLDQLVPVFQAGHTLLLLRQYSAAFRCFVHIARLFPSREIHNNAGLARALQGVDLFKAEELRFLYPFELDGSSRLARRDKAADPDLLEDDLRYQLLEEAAQWFERARQQDRSYIPAYINQACVADLLDEPDEALLWAGRARKLAERQGQPLALAHALLIGGIARARGNPANLETARRDFAAARETAPDLARINLAALEGATAAAGPVQRPPAFAAGGEQIGGHAASDYADLLSQSRIVVVPGGGPGALTVYTHRTVHWQSLVIDTGYSTVAALASRPGYAGTSGRGLQLGAKRALMTAAYGQPAFRLAGPLGTHHAYPDLGTVFEIDPDDRIRSWIIYRIEE
ncbi:MAG: hypothetical protein GKR89_30415 [Candidatus Latescibacteria bacterium]|nr:hypothetical protein [Candidatus Latescibacterota bacterium]